MNSRTVAMRAQRLRHSRAMLTLAFAFFVGGQSASRAAPGPSPDDAYLDELKGAWDMSGTLLGKPVRYQARGERVLQGGFLQLHMLDASGVPPYEADVFIGFDARAGDFVAHWLDRFGAAGARVVAKGVRQGPRLVIQFPYAEGAFRDTFVWRAETGSWSLLLESRAKDGTWSTFANYALTRPKKSS
jgi:hypothetical protein